MNKKQQRKELEAALFKTIEDLLISINPESASQISDITYGASRILAKKFYKSVKHKEEKKAQPAKQKPEVKKVVAPNKKAAKKVAPPAAKKPAKPAKAKSKK